MAGRKTKIVFEQIDPLGATKTQYRVVALTNRTVPKIGDVLKETDVQELIRESEGLTVEIKPGKRRR
jgi:hypothetical protein